MVKLTKGMSQALRKDCENSQKVPKKKMGEGEAIYQRRLYKSNRQYWNDEKIQVGNVKNIQEKTRHGDCKIRLYLPDVITNETITYIHIHGGGFVVGDMDTHDRICRFHCQYGDMAVLSIDYKKAPEYKYPHAFEEIIDAIGNFTNRMAEHGLNAEKMAIGGDSAGAHLSLAILLYYRNQAMHNKIKAGVFYYGYFGLKPPKNGSMDKFGADDSYLLSKKDMQFYLSMYLRNEKDANDMHFNLLQNDFNDLPPLLITALSQDALLDDSRYLKDALKTSNSIFKYSEYDGVLHGVLHYSHVEMTAKLMMLEACAYLKLYVA